jgi:hypothetical protein
MFRKPTALTSVLTIAIVLGAVSAPALAETRSHQVMKPHRHDRISPYAGGVRNQSPVIRNQSPVNRDVNFLTTEECEVRGIPDCH